MDTPRITVLASHSCSLEIVSGAPGSPYAREIEGGGGEMEDRVDLIISEIADEGLLGEVVQTTT